MSILSNLKGLKLVKLGNDLGYEADSSQPFDDYCFRCRLSKLYLAKDCDDIVVCPVCKTTYRIIPLKILSPSFENLHRKKCDKEPL